MAINRGHADWPIARVCHDNFGDLGRCYGALVDNGFQRIGLLAHPNTDERMGHWISGAFFARVAGVPSSKSFGVDNQHNATEVTTWCGKLKSQMRL